MAQVTLETVHIEFADKVGRWRWSNVVRDGLTSTNNGPNQEDMHIMGARCEAAAKLYLNPITWHAWGTVADDLPDLGDYIDVKGSTFPGNDLILTPQCKYGRAYLSVNAKDHPNYEIVGWGWGSTMMQKRFWAERVKGRAAYWVPRSVLLPSSGLLDIVRANGDARPQPVREAVAAD